MTKITFNSNKSEFLIEFIDSVNFPSSNYLDSIIKYLKLKNNSNIIDEINNYILKYPIEFENHNYIIIGKFFNFSKYKKYKYYTKKDIVYNISRNINDGLSCLYVMEKRWDNWNYELIQSISLFNVISLDKIELTNKLNLAIYLYVLKHS